MCVPITDSKDEEDLRRDEQREEGAAPTEECFQKPLRGPPLTSRFDEDGLEQLPLFDLRLPDDENWQMVFKDTNTVDPPQVHEHTELIEDNDITRHYLAMAWNIICKEEPETAEDICMQRMVQIPITPPYPQEHRCLITFRRFDGVPFVKGLPSAAEILEIFLE